MRYWQQMLMASVNNTLPSAASDQVHGLGALKMGSLDIEPFPNETVTEEGVYKLSN